MNYLLSEQEYEALLKKANAEHFIVVDSPHCTLDEVIKLYCNAVVKYCKGNISDAAKKLRVHRQTVAKYVPKKEEGNDK